MRGKLRLGAGSESGDESPHSKKGADSNCFTRGAVKVLYNIKYSMLRFDPDAGETGWEGDLDEGQDDIAGVDRG